MRFSPIADRLARDDTQAWNVHRLALERRARGDDIIMLTIDDPDFETPPVVVEAAYAAMLAGRTHYADSQGDLALRQENAKRAAVRRSRSPEPLVTLSAPSSPGLCEWLRSRP